jgi:hypothetical protein
VDEQQWLTSTDSQAMLDFLQASGEVSDRKARLCVVAWARSFHHHAAKMPGGAPFLSWLAGPQWLPQLEAAEAYADGRLDGNALRSVRQKTGGPYNLYRVAAGLSHFSFREAGRIIQFVRREFGAPPEAELCDLLRCIFDCLPFRPAPPIASSALVWNRGTIPRLAQAAYEERSLPSGTLDRARLAILADALEEAGCTDEKTLGHLRGPGPHLRGCHVVDRLLGKS